MCVKLAVERSERRLGFFFCGGGGSCCCWRNVGGVWAWHGGLAYVVCIYVWIGYVDVSVYDVHVSRCGCGCGCVSVSV